MIDVRGVAFAYPGGDTCIDDVSFRAQAGERVALVGGNGAGKSTLLQLLAGHRVPSRGTCRIDGRRVDVPQNPDLALFCETVRAELAYGPGELGLEEDGGVATALGVAHLMERPPQALSRGQRLRVAVAAALVCQPRVLLLDEPTSGQDRDQVDRMLHAVASRLTGGVLVFASHDLDVVLRHATRVLVLRGGRLVADGFPLPTLDGHLPLPPLARLCLSLGVPYTDPDVLAGRLVSR